jgi:hypothetical protein
VLSGGEKEYKHDPIYGKRSTTAIDRSTIPEFYTVYLISIPLSSLANSVRRYRQFTRMLNGVLNLAGNYDTFPTAVAVGVTVRPT